MKGIPLHPLRLKVRKFLLFLLLLLTVSIGETAVAINNFSFWLFSIRTRLGNYWKKKRGIKVE